MANPNNELLNAVVARLGTFANDFTFLGGCTVGLYITDPAAANVRPTKDVDGIVQALTYAEYVRVEEKIASLGFSRVEQPICRWEIEGLLIDVLPVKGDFIGFRSKWFAEAVDSAIFREIKSGVTIRLINPVYLIATKLEAFHDRGKQDYLSSHDLEDILTLVNGREELIDEINSSEGTVHQFICSSFKSLLAERYFLESIPGHLNPETERTEMIIDRIKRIAAD